MTRKAFVADVAAERTCTASSINSVEIGDEGEDFVFNYITGSGDPVLIRALATDISAYPTGNTYFLGLDCGTAPAVYASALENIQGFLTGLTIHDLLIKTAETLRSLESGSILDPSTSGDDNIIMGDDDHAMQHAYSSQENGEDDEYDDGNWSPGSSYSDAFLPSSNIKMGPSESKVLHQRIKQDVARVKMAGFRVGILIGMEAESTYSILSISIKVAHLGLSDQAIEAWDLERLQYIVLLIYYGGPYVTFPKVINTNASQLPIEFRLGACNRYKPSLSEAVAAFSETRLQATYIYTSMPNIDEDQENHDSKFQSLFISSPMNQLINDRFLNLLKIRKSDGLGWEQAKYVYNQRLSTATMSAEKPQYNTISEDISKKGLPPLATTDHLEDPDDEGYSLPLIAMQFALRYLIRCTEFCLVCHQKTEESFEALKPYVCSNPLCLYQYMSLGFGPSIEHTVATQPYVVDLLISFAYASANSQKLRIYPIGMGLMVPQPVIVPFALPFPQGPSISPPIDPNASDSKARVIHDVTIILAERKVIMDTNDYCDASPGDWVEITTLSRKDILHFRVASYTHPHMNLINFGLEEGNISLSGVDIFASSLNDPIQVKLAVFNRKFDDLEESEKNATIVSLLRNMPSINEMRTYLQTRKASGEPSFRNWVDRLCPAALGLLRWIVASNRSCIVQVDRYPGQLEADNLLNTSRMSQKVTNLDGWMQFRFAQGAPDKEHRFNQALTSKQYRISEDFPTLFAWHGSPVHNWHGIIRTGLDFDEISNGRSFGNGCYHSQRFEISLSYCSNRSSRPSISGLGLWPGSNLKIVQAICLNEIVNAPHDFTSTNPHLVVQHVDWIQCRYLFVQCGDGVGGIGKVDEPKGSIKLDTVQYIKQDPQRQVMGNNNKVLGIPRSAFPSSRVFSVENDELRVQMKKQKTRSPAHLLFGDELDSLSDDSDLEDINFLINEEGSHPTRKVDTIPPTYFIPGSLDRSTIQLLGPPSYATSAATSTLSRDLQALLKVQSTTPLHELGWYIDGNVIDNMYQWIVELHSFDLELPLAIEMKEAGISSVVLEMRFGRNYPMSPPFVRVIRPRFLPFMAGGGGHVTAGGAMCMELLTNSGWSAVSSIESVLLQVRMAISSTDPKPAKLERRGAGHQQDYGVGEAIDAYLRACKAHGWEASDMGDFREGASNSST